MVTDAGFMQSKWTCHLLEIAATKEIGEVKEVCMPQNFTLYSN